MTTPAQELLLAALSAVPEVPLPLASTTFPGRPPHFFHEPISIIGVTNLRDPLHSLKQGTWFKLICGASFQDLPAIHNLSLVYSLAGVDCIDVAADPTVVEAARGGMAAAQVYLESARSRGTVPQSQALAHGEFKRRG